MDVASLLGPVLGDVAQAAGLVTAAGDLDPSWFGAPLGRLESILTDATQRAAVLDLLDQIAPPAEVPGAPQNQRWHPLLGPQPSGNLYLTVDDSADPTIVVGLAGQYGDSSASLLFELPIAQLSGTRFSALAGTANGPLNVTLAVTLGWTTAGHPIALDGISVALVLAPAASPAIADVKITLQGLDLDGTGARDVVLDPQRLSSDATGLILGLVRGELDEPGAVTGDAALLAAHLIPLLGLDGSLPAFPVATVGSDTTALATWLRSLVSGSPAPMQTWLAHLAGLLGVPTPTVVTTASASGTAWSVTLFTPNAASSVGLNLAQTAAADGVTPQLEVGITFALSPPGANPPARLDASATVFTLPLAGSAAGAAFPSASFVLAAPGDPAQKLIAPAAATPFSLDSLRAGLRWTGGTVTPLLEMDNVVIGTTPYPVIDLTNASTVISAGISAAVASALGHQGAGAHLAALAGVIEPAADPAAPLADPVQLATHPTTALATLHRNALLSAAHPWSNYFSELTALLGQPGPVSGNGTFAEPWSAAIAASGPLTLSLIAWNAQTSPNAADPQQLRIGLQISAGSAPVQASLGAEVFGVDLQAAGPSKVAILGGYHASMHVTPGSTPVVSGTWLNATSIDAAFDLSVGAAPVTTASITGLSVTTGNGTINVPKVEFPFPGGFDITNPTATLGIGVTDLETLVLGLLARALGDQFGSVGLALAALIGCTAGIPGLQADFPVLADPSGPGSLFGDPLGALRGWLATVAAGLSANGTDFATPLVTWLAGLLAQLLPADAISAPDPAGLAGSGSYDDPWLLPLGAADSAATGLAWLEPAGPPSTAPLASAAIEAAKDFPALAAAFGAASRYLPAIPPSLGASALATSLQALSVHLTSTDGVVPVTSQTPAGGTWTAGTPIAAPHHLQPGDPSACTQILAQVNTWALPGSPRAILLLGPAFSDHTTWSTLLAQAEAADPGTTSPAATFNLRLPGVDPSSIDLRTVTVVADYYTADLQDDGSGNVASLVTQIGLVQARIASLKPGVPVILVAHSTAGLAARAYTQANPGNVKGLITLGTPHAGAPLTPLTDPATAEAVRACAHLFPAGVAPGPLHDALAHLLQALDGYLPPATGGALPTAWPYPVGDFAGAASTDTGGVPALALGGQLGGAAGVDLLSSLQAAAAASPAAFTAAAPTHLGYGVRIGLPLGADVAVAAAAAVRIDVGRLALQDGVPDPPRSAHALSVNMSLSKQGGWLAGGPTSYAGPSITPVNIRVRSAELGLYVVPADGKLSATPTATLHEASYLGPTSDVVTWTDARLQPLLGSVFAANAATPPTAATSLGGLLAVLQELGIAADPQGGFSISTDALNALAVDPIGYLTPKVSAAFATPGTLGFTAAGSATSVLTIGTLPLEVFVQTSPATIGLRTATAGTGLALAADVRLAFSVGLPLETMTPAVSATFTAGPATLGYSDGALTLQIPPDLPSLPLFPAPPPATVESALAKALPALLVSVSASALIDSVLEPGYVVSGIEPFLRSPGQWLVQSTALGDGTVFDPAKISQFLTAIGTLPAGLTLTPSGTNPTTLALATSAPLGGLLDLSLDVTIDATRHLAPSGSFGITAPLPGGTWPSVTITFGVDPAGISLTVTPGGGTAIELLPTFSGAGALLGAAEALLPQALDGLRAALPPGPITPLALDVAAALDLYDPVGGFAAHGAQLAALTSAGWFAALSAAARTAFLNAVAAVFNDPTSPLHEAMPGTISLTADTIGWSFALPAGLGTGSFAIAVGWDGSGPTVTAGAENVTPNGAPVTVTLASGYANGALALDATVGLSLQGSLGISVVPQLALTIEGTAPKLAFLPLGSAAASTLAVQLLPSPNVVAAAGAAGALVSGYAIPLVADLLIAATGTDFSKPLWTGGPTTEQVLSSAGLITIGAGPAPQKYSLKTPMPGVDAVLGGLLQAVTPYTVPLAQSPPLALSFVDDSGKFGVRLLGSIALSGAGSPQVSMLFGAPATWLGPGAGVTLYLFSTAGGLQFAPELLVRGAGLGLAGRGDAPLLDASGFRIGAADAYLAFELDLLRGGVSGLGGGVEIDQLGLPISQFDSASASNPVAASLLDSNGSSGGDDPSVNPAVDVIAYDLDGSFTIEFAGTSGPVVIPVHASFGPVYLDQVDLALSGANAVTLGIDGDVKIAGLDVSLIELALSIPLHDLLSPEHWSLDLQGLAVSYSEDPIEITGGLRKSPGPPIEYDGMLSLSVEDLGLTIVGSYSRPSDAQGPYTSLFMFVSLGDPLGGPPFAFVIGLGGGFGYNRELNVPDDLSSIDSFVLVSAIDDSSLANDPMSALLNMGTQIPPSRGAFWIAAGVRLTTFGLINSTVIVTIALDRGFEINILGISRMALPTEDVALVSVELALRARFSSEEGILSVQAQLTDNSYIFSHDCQLTGGFAFFVWYLQGQFVLTMGGYNPAFTKPPQFPEVPRLGFNWSVGSDIVVKGGCYFALTDSCVMAGGSLSATASFGPVSAWFDAYLDFLVSWDPFAYEFDIGIEIGASLSIQVCFFACVTIGITVSLGASLMIAGPPFHGTASISYYVTTITVSFGDPPAPPPYITDWNTFAGKYLTAGDPNSSAVSTQFNTGVLSPDPPGAQPQPGTASQPVQVGIEFSLTTTTRMPATSTSDFLPGSSASPVAGLNALDVAPMDWVGVGSVHTLALAQQQDGSWATPVLDVPAEHFTITPVTGLFPEATWHWTDPAHLPAAARTIAAVSGLKVDAHVVLNDLSQLIPISALVADLAQYALPLPFATTVIISPILEGYGAAADSLAAAIAAASSKQMLAASLGMLTGNGVFAQNRAAFGLPPAGLGPFATQALQQTRSAPPLVAPITTGLTLKPVGLDPPHLAESLLPVSPVLLEQPRLRAMLQTEPQPVADAPAAPHTSVTTLAAQVSGVPRMHAPAPPAVPGARLLTVPAVAAPRPTRAAVRPRAIRNADLGAAIGAAQQQALAQAASALTGSGVTLGAGAAHLWDLPADSGSFTCSGDSCVRIICTERSGGVLTDTEFAAAGSSARPVPAGTEMVLVQALGAPAAGTTVTATGFGAITSIRAPAGQRPAVGWQSTSTLLQIGPSRFAGRGSTVHVARAYATRRNGQRASYGTVAAADAVAGQIGVETRLPATVTVVIIALDVADQGAAQAGDLAVGFTGGTLAGPQRVLAGQRRLLFYDVASADAGATSFTVSVASAQAWKVGAVIGAGGAAAELASALAGGIPDRFVPDGPMSPGGSVTVTYTPGAAS